MKIIQKMSYGSADFLATQLEHGHLKRNEYYFGFQVVYQAVLKVLVLTILAIILGTLKPTLFIVLSFTSLRFFAGGVHMDTYAKCLLITLAAFIPASLICKYLMTGQMVSIIIILCTAIIVVLIIGLWAPKDSPVNQIADKAKKTLKKASMLIMIVWSVLAVILSLADMTEIATPICCGLLIEASTILPAGAAAYTKLDKIIK